MTGLGYDTSIMMRSIPLRGFDQVGTYTKPSTFHKIVTKDILIHQPFQS